MKYKEFLFCYSIGATIFIWMNEYISGSMYTYAEHTNKKETKGHYLPLHCIQTIFGHFRINHFVSDSWYFQKS